MHLQSSGSVDILEFPSAVSQPFESEDTESGSGDFNVIADSEHSRQPNIWDPAYGRGRHGTRHILLPKFAGCLDPEPKATAEIWFQPQDGEAEDFTKAIERALVLANWNIGVAPQPIPSGLSLSQIGARAHGLTILHSRDLTEDSLAALIPGYGRHHGRWSCRVLFCTDILCLLLRHRFPRIFPTEAIGLMGRRSKHRDRLHFLTARRHSCHVRAG